MIKIICVFGLTGTGKTEYAVKLAKKINGYCLSADSRQWYRGSPVGSNQPKGKMVAPKGVWKKIIKDDKYLEISGVPYLACNSWHKKRAITAMDFKKYCLGVISRQQKYAPDLTPILVGGTGLYIKAVIEPDFLQNVSKPNANERKRLQKLSVAELQKELKKLSLAEYKKLADPKNPHRLIRAIEKHSYVPSRVEVSDRHSVIPAKAGIYLNFEPKIIWLKQNQSPETYKKQIARRTNQILNNGWIAEVEKLLKNSPRHPLLTGIGYRNIVDFINNKNTKPEMITKINAAMWQYARRQKNYFKNQLQK